MKLRASGTAFVLTLLATAAAHAADGALTAYASHQCAGRTCTFKSATGQELRLTAYGDHMIRVQAVTAGQAYYPDDRYPMVKSHAMGGALTATDQGASVKVASAAMGVQVEKSPLRVRLVDGAGNTLLEEDTTKQSTTGDRPLTLTVNGSPVGTGVSFPFTGWKNWRTVTVQATLQAGANLVRVTAAGASGGNIDSLKVNGTTYEAENATRQGVTVGTQYPGYTGSGYADFTNLSNDYVEFNVNVPSTGTYNLDFVYANGAPPSLAFKPSAQEHFVGLGHGTYGRVDKLDLKGSVVAHNRALQSPLVVPLLVSSKGYGVFVNSSFATTFSLTDADYSVALTGGQLDYFLIDGPHPAEILDRYTQLTGRPRLPPLSAFGLSLSDKIGDTLPSDEAWWKAQVTRLRQEGYPIDVIVHDNAWRGGKTAAWQWDTTRYPDPAEFETWCKQNGVTNQLDFNRADAPLSAGWQASYALPGTTDWPDFSAGTPQTWFWTLLRTQSFDPQKQYPGDSLWLDEFDEDVTPTGKLANGWDWEEAANLYFFWMAQSVGEGWETVLGGTKRPYIMARGMTAGAQRWSSLWSGDIQNTYDEMKQQIRGMLAAGLSGFPFEAHDAGGFFNKPTDAMYRQWSLAMGSFSPMWKPHGPPLRFPWLFGTEAQNDAHKYGALRMELMPYTYTYAARAEESGAPLARAMAFEYPDAPEAWARDLQYMWGHEILVAPATNDGGGTVNVWFPPGAWYDLWDDTRVDGGAARDVAAPTGRLPLFVRAGAIVPRALASLGTALWDRTVRVVDVYAGASGSFTLHEDDGVSGAHLAGKRSKTPMTYTDGAAMTLEIGPEDGTYTGAPSQRKYRARFHGLADKVSLFANSQPLRAASSEQDANDNGGLFWDAQKKILLAVVNAVPVGQKLVLSVQQFPGDDGGVTPGGDGGVQPGDGATPGSSGGCGCTEVPAGTNGGAGVALLVSALLLRARGRRRSPPAA